MDKKPRDLIRAAFCMDYRKLITALSAAAAGFIAFQLQLDLCLEFQFLIFVIADIKRNQFL